MTSNESRQRETRDTYKDAGMFGCNDATGHPQVELVTADESKNSGRRWARLSRQPAGGRSGCTSAHLHN